MNSLADLSVPMSPVTPESALVFEEIRSIKEQLKNLPQTTRFTDEQIEIIYGIAYAMYNQGKLDAAHGLFETLVIYRPMDARIMLAYGICCKKMLRFDAAIPALTSAFFCNPEDLTSAIHLSECLAVIGKYEECKKVLDPLIGVAALDEKFSSIQRRAQTLKEMLQNHQKETPHEK